MNHHFSFVHISLDLLHPSICAEFNKIWLCVCVFREHLVYLDWEAPKGYLDLSEMKVPQDLKDSEEMEENEEASVK